MVNQWEKNVLLLVGGEVPTSKENGKSLPLMLCKKKEKGEMGLGLSEWYKERK